MSRIPARVEVMRSCHASSTDFSLDDAALERRLEQDEREKKAVLEACAGTAQHFFGGLTSLFCQVADPRMPALLLYPVVSLALAGILMYATHLKARRQIGLQYLCQSCLFPPVHS